MRILPKPMKKIIPVIAFLLAHSVVSSCAQAAVTLSGGDDSDVLSRLLNTKYLNDAPVLLLSGQNDGELILSRNLNNVDNLVVTDENLDEFAIDLLSPFAADPFGIDGRDRSVVFDVYLSMAGIHRLGPMDISVMLKNGKHVLHTTIDAEDFLKKYKHLATLDLKEEGARLPDRFEATGRIGDVENSRLIIVRASKRNMTEDLLVLRSKDPRVELTYIFKDPAHFFSIPQKDDAVYVLKACLVVQEGTPDVTREPFCAIDGQPLAIRDFDRGSEKGASNTIFLEKTVDLDPGTHRYEIFNNDSFDVEWLIFEPRSLSLSAKDSLTDASITFHRINPTKYVIRVRHAKGPFWLVLSETYHSGWHFYHADPEDLKASEPVGIPTEYSAWNVREVRPTWDFSPRDIRFLNLKPLNAQHFQVNSYANGWYLEPGDLGEGENFDLVLFFYPQSVFYLGFFITLTVLSACVVWRGRFLFMQRRRRNL